MGRQLKRKDPKKRKKATDVSPEVAADQQPDKKNVASIAKSSVAAKVKNTPAGPQKSVKSVRKEPESGVRLFVDKTVQFLREVRVELRKVTWPSRKQTIGSTAVVLVLVILVSLFLGIVDAGLSNLIRMVIR